MAISNSANATVELASGTPAGESKNWNWHPDIPIQYSPLFSFPPNPWSIVKWYASAWLPLTELTCYLLLAIAVFFWFQPPLAETTSFAFEWVGALWFRNFLFMVLIATFLHLWLYHWRKQGDKFCYMRNTPTAKHRRFMGGDQLRDNIFFTLVSGVTVWSIYESLLWYAMANGISPTMRFTENPFWFVLWFPLIGIWFSFHFYCVHRFSTLEADVQSFSFSASPQYHCWSLVWVFDAPG